jgi:hypothetical protein
MNIHTSALVNEVMIFFNAVMNIHISTLVNEIMNIHTSTYTLIMNFFHVSIVCFLQV